MFPASTKKKEIIEHPNGVDWLRKKNKQTKVLWGKKKILIDFRDNELISKVTDYLVHQTKA